MAKLGRNDHCHCGSGMKYKKCCQPQDEAREREQRHVASLYGPTTNEPFFIDDGYDDLDDLSNSVLDLVKDGELDEADDVCDQLARLHPDQVDALERRAHVLEARKRPLEAAAYYRQAAEFARTHDGFDPEGVAWFEEQAARLDPAAR